ncbi:galactokinase [Sphingobacterium sp. SRCM116780]|uniref:galactokinase n=1 Tax=Sphingobacterium sp. SRCM116780 TaxID=2907623 RepID=UPI001F1E0F58|nr:galactokinase [Sphingobacterium sp. SRCM116780]UIR55559.1 galactokinase [Sphingobacterium sp. SRCM116780]
MITKESIKNKFKSIFQEDPIIARSPGRINIIGEHTDYNDGFVLPAAIDKAVYIAVSKRADDLISLYAEDYKGKYEVNLHDIAPTDLHWPNYILGVVDQIQKRGLTIGGFNLYIDGDVPLGAGLSSSAAVECATTLALSELFQLHIERLEIPKIGQLAEHTYAGVKCGIMDQFASTFGKKDQVLKLDCRSLEYEYVPLILEGYTIILLNTNVKHALGDTAYNKRVEQCKQAIGWIKEKYPAVVNMRDVSVAMLDEMVKDKDAEVYTKTRFVVEESERVHQACENLKAGNLVALGQNLLASHHGLSQEYEVSCAESDYLVEFIIQFPEVLGARQMGGGFGGCTINLVKDDFIEELIAQVSPKYAEKFGKELTVISVKTDDGTSIL